MQLHGSWTRMKPQRAHWWDPRTWLAFAFWELRTIFAAVRDDGWSDWKATLVIIAVEILGIGALPDAISVYMGRRIFDESIPFLFIVAFVVAILNTKALIGKNKRWNRLSTEFESYSRPIRIGGGWAVVLLVILTIIAFGHFGQAQRYLPR